MIVVSGYSKSSHYISSYSQDLHLLVTVIGHDPAAAVDLGHLGMNLSSWVFVLFFRAFRGSELTQWLGELNYIQPPVTNPRNLDEIGMKLGRFYRDIVNWVTTVYISWTS